MPVVPKRAFTFDRPVVDRNGSEIPPTFSQRYWTTWEFYEPGGPIVLNTPGETDADGLEIFLTNQTIVGQIAQQQNGATVMLEHRFYGFSNPYQNLSVASLQVHTIPQAIDDLAYFANNVQLPMPGGDQLSPANAPWILVGGSYAGALTSYTLLKNFWQYFDIPRQYMPQNCSADVQAVIAYIDETFVNGTTEEIDAIETTFGMNLTHLDDFSYALTNPLAAWQNLQPDGGSDQLFFQFCDALEVKDGVNASAEGWGLDYALQAWGSWWQDVYIPGCTPTPSCFDTYDPTNPVWTNITVNNSQRSWGWIGGAPEGDPTIVSRLVDPAYYERWCTYYFPEAFPTAAAPDVDAINKAYDGWFLSTERLFQATGKRDSWLDATVGAQGLNTTSTDLQPIAMSDGFHCSDMYAANAVVDSTVAAVQNQGLSSIATWLQDWQPST
ncbi:hypothetical protein IEO21_08476 [Rhodonia placenta]|uniref:Peptidase S28 n=1 Tax=Rhodonia placenta TaxID=104341 RepID=A0A8H7NW86_9APHY|nr:hypothetical protein IEO21_08476 [Postia placenta]